MIVIPVAGRGQRFRNSGYKTPKWKLMVGGRTLLEWSLLSFAEMFKKETFLVISRDREIGLQLREIQVELGISEISFVLLEAPTNGQAETVMQGLKQLSVPDYEPVTIFNTDTFRPGYQPTARQSRSDAWLECVKAEGDHWSFVLEDTSVPGKVARVEEKRRISNNCSTGIYYFSRRKLFDEAYSGLYAEPPGTELFVAPLFNYLIDRGDNVLFDLVDPGDVFFSGTPAEYEDCVQREGLIVESFQRSTLRKS